jgi:hypothetical protein
MSRVPMPIWIGLAAVVMVAGCVFAYKYDQKWQAHCRNDLHGHVLSHTSYTTTIVTTYDKKGNPHTGTGTSSTTTTWCASNNGTVLEYEN